MVILAYMFIKCQLLKGKKLPFVIHFEFFNNRHKPTIDVKELTFINEAIIHLGYKISRHILAHPYTP